MKICKWHPLFRYAITVRLLVPFPSKQTNVGVTHVVAENDNHIWLLLG